MLRPGRLDKHLLCDLPNESDRKEILDILCKQVEFESNHIFDSQKIAAQTQYFSPADLQMIFNISQTQAFHRAYDAFKKTYYKNKNKKSQNNKDNNNNNNNNNNEIKEEENDNDNDNDNDNEIQNEIQNENDNINEENENAGKKEELLNVQLDVKIGEIEINNAIEETRKSVMSNRQRNNNSTNTLNIEPQKSILA